jgi:hypothetical protein
LKTIPGTEKVFFCILALRLKPKMLFTQNKVLATKLVHQNFVYQLDFTTPGNNPCRAYSRKTCRDNPKSRK